MSNKTCLEGSVLTISQKYGGLGAHYLNTLSENINKMNQIDTINGISETNGSVRTRAMQIGSEMRRLGVNENDIVLICSRGHSDQTVTVLACLVIGAIAAPLPIEVNHLECLEMVKKLKPKMCFCDIRAMKQVDRVLNELELKTTFVLYGEHKANLNFQKLLSNKMSTEFKPVAIDKPHKRVAFILPTQGTMGCPKLVCLSHHFIYSHTMILLNLIKKPDKMISFFPLCWILQVILMCLSFELPIVRVLGGAFSERTACKLIQDMKIDYVFLSTDSATKLAEHVAVRDFNLSCLSYIFIGGSYRSVNVIKHIVTRLPKVKFIQIYCTTETGIVATCPVSDYEESMERLGTVGKVVYNTKVKVVNIQSRQELGSEKYGELLVSGEAMMLGYFKNMPLTKSVMENNFFKTGDVARFDGSGWLYIEEKVDDILFTSDNERLSPLEVETVITLHPYVNDAAVVGDEKEILACIILKPDTKLDEPKLLTFISQRLPVDKWPTRIVYMDSFPTSAVGKVKKNILRSNYLKIQIERSDSCPDVTRTSSQMEPQKFESMPKNTKSTVLPTKISQNKLGGTNGKNKKE